MALIIDTGTYTGNDTDDRIITYNRFADLGVSPDAAAGWMCFIISSATATASGSNAFKTDAWSSTNHSMRHFGTLFNNTGDIKSVTAAGIKLGTTTAVNSSSNTYRWWVIADGLGEDANTFVTGTYTGTGAPLAVTGVGFAPDCVMTFRQDTTNNGGFAVRMQSVGTGNDLTWADMGQGPTDTDHITSLDADGFTLGATANNSNNNNVEYGYVAFKRMTNSCEQDTYDGDDTDDRDIVHPTNTFQPEIVWILNTGTERNLERTDQYSGDLSSTPQTGSGGGGAPGAGHIQAFNTDGFQVGSNAIANVTGTTYHYLSLRDNYSAGEAFGGAPPRYSPFIRSVYRAGTFSKYQRYKTAKTLSEMLRNVRVI